MAGKIVLLFAAGVLLFAGCTYKNQERELEQRRAALNEKEQQLVLKEQSLDLREQVLNEREKVIDSTTKKIANDSLYLKYPAIPGKWNVKMVCTDTNCPGSAIGDTKNEQWEFAFQDNSVIVSATSNNKLVRVYSGSIQDGSMKLSLSHDFPDSLSSSMTVRLQLISEKEMTGEREIVQSSGCRIIYSLQLKK